MNFEILKKSFLSHPEMSSIVISDGNGRHFRLFKYPVKRNVEYLYYSDVIKSYASAPSFYFAGIVVDGCKLYVSEFAKFLRFDGSCETMQNAIRHVLEEICKHVAEIAKDVSVPLPQSEQNKALETAYMAYVRESQPIFCLNFYGYEDVAMLAYYFEDPNGWPKRFAQQYFEEKRDFCLRQYSIYKAALTLIESWSADKDCLASLSRSMFQAAEKVDALVIVIRSGGKEYTASVATLGNVYTNGDVNGDYQIDSLPAKEYLDSGGKRLTTISKKSIDELCAVDGTVFWRRS